MKKFLFCLVCLSFVVLTGCDKKCPSGYEKEDGKCTKYTLNESALVTTYSCEEGWTLDGTECVSGEMPPIGEGCEEGTTDRIGSDGFCHHYKDATPITSCAENTVLKDGKCYTVETK